MKTPSPTRAAPAEVKRLGYVLGLAGAVAALLSGLLLERSDLQADPVDHYGLPLMATAMLLLMLAFLRSKGPTSRLEVATFVLLSVFLLVQLGSTVYLQGHGSPPPSEELPQFVVWFPTLYAATLFMLGVERGWRIALWHFGLSLALGLPYIVVQLTSSGSLLVVYALCQLYLSSAVLIITSMIFVRHTEGMVRARAEAENLAHTDFVTALGNRRQMELLLDQEVDRAERYGQELSILLLDLDHFKRVNDRYGHPVGDAVLKEVSMLLRHEARSADSVGRWGGEEFLFILPNTGEETLSGVGVRLAERLASHGFTTIGRLTASLGGATLRLGERRGDIVRRADNALYRAKAEGRNRVVIAPSGSSTSLPSPRTARRP